MLESLSASRLRQAQLVADAGHELRTPLTSLRTNLELLAQADRSGGLPADARAEVLHDVRAQIDEMSTLVDDLVELARDEPMQRDPEPTDLADVVDAAAARVRRRAPAGTVIDVDTEPWLVMGEPVLLQRAVTNLLDNAVKWGPHDGVITVELRDGQLTVRDRGPGHRRRGPAARLRPLLPLGGGADAARIGAGAGDRAPHCRAARRDSPPPATPPTAARCSPCRCPAARADPKITPNSHVLLRTRLSLLPHGRSMTSHEPHGWGPVGTQEPAPDPAPRPRLRPVRADPPRRRPPAAPPDRRVAAAP